MKKLLLIITIFLLLSNYDSKCQNLRWAESVAYQTIDVQCDSNNQFYSIGNFSNTINLDHTASSQVFTSRGLSDIAIIKYSGIDGKIIWAKQLGGSGDDYISAMKLDRDSNIYIAGNFNGIVDFDFSANSQELDAGTQESSFIAKYDKNGTLLWAEKFGSSEVYFNALDIDLNNNLVVGGSYSGEPDMDPSSVTEKLFNVYYDNIFFGKYSSADGSLIYIKTVHGTNYATTWCQLNDIKTDDNGNIAITGYFFNTIDFDPSVNVANKTSNGNPADVFIAKYSGNDGSYNWVNTFGGPTGDEGKKIIFDEFENVYLVGEFDGTVDVDPSNNTKTLVSTSSDNAFVVKYDDAGNFVWGEAYDCSNGSMMDVKISISSHKELIILAYYTGTIDSDLFSGISNISTAQYGIFLGKYSLSGTLITSIPLIPNAGIRSISCNNNNEVYICGEFSTNADFDPSGKIVNLSNTNSFNFYVGKYTIETLFTTGVNNSLPNDYIKMYPVPSSGNVMVSGSEAALSKLKIFNSKGVLVFEQEIELSSIENLDLSSLSGGIYLVQIMNNGKYWESKLVLQK